MDAQGDFGEVIFADFNTDFKMRSRVSSDGTNQGNAILQVEVTDASMLTGGNYTLRVNGGNYEIFSVDENTAIASGTIPLPSTISLSDEGIDIHLDFGAVQDGDAFYISPTRRGSDQIEMVLNEPSQLAFAAPIRATSSLNNRGDVNITQPELTTTLDANNQALVGDSGGVPFDLVYDEASSAWQVTGLPSGYSVTPSFCGFRLRLAKQLHLYHIRWRR